MLWTGTGLGPLESISCSTGLLIQAQHTGDLLLSPPLRFSSFASPQTQGESHLSSPVLSFLLLRPVLSFPPRPTRSFSYRALFTLFPCRMFRVGVAVITSC